MVIQTNMVNLLRWGEIVILVWIPKINFKLLVFGKAMKTSGKMSSQVQKERWHRIRTTDGWMGKKTPKTFKWLKNLNYMQLRSNNLKYIQCNLIFWIDFSQKYHFNLSRGNLPNNMTEINLHNYTVSYSV